MYQQFTDGRIGKFGYNTPTFAKLVESVASVKNFFYKTSGIKFRIPGDKFSQRLNIAQSTARPRYFSSHRANFFRASSCETMAPFLTSLNPRPTF